MFANARLQTLVCSTDPPRSERFYSDVLGLPLVERARGALVYHVSGQPLRVSPVPSLVPSAHTVLGFAVQDLGKAIARLVTRGVSLERFHQLPHDADGVVSLPDGTRVAWFRDPDGNLLSAVQYPS
jgi:catechol 2,3-dioxygenase-like lactoylglutathione lyase family enzyme